MVSEGFLTGFRGVSHFRQEDLPVNSPSRRLGGGLWFQEGFKPI